MAKNKWVTDVTSPISGVIGPYLYLVGAHLVAYTLGVQKLHPSKPAIISTSTDSLAMSSDPERENLASENMTYPESN